MQVIPMVAAAVASARAVAMLRSPEVAAEAVAAAAARGPPRGVGEAMRLRGAVGGGLGHAMPHTELEVADLVEPELSLVVHC